MNVRDDLLHSLLAGLERDQQTGLLDRIERAREEQLRAKRRTPAELEVLTG